MIPDPFFGDNEKHLQWIGTQQWEFQTSFTAEQALFASKHIEMIFSGLDTYCEIFLNKTKLGQTENAFREYRFDVANTLLPGLNLLRLKFLPLDSIEKEKAKAYPFSFPEQRCFTRKPAYQSGWDWGPVYKTAGITGKIELRSFQKLSIEQLSVVTLTAQTDSAVLEVLTEIESAVKQDVTLQISIDSVHFTQTTVQLQKGKQRISLPVVLNHPRLWWPNGAGKQELYTVEVACLHDNKIVDQQTITTGIRTVELVSEKDTKGQSFYFKVNGRTIFMKGANLIPMDNFITRIDTGKMFNLLKQAADVQMNMLRVWGGGYYPSEVFYSMCDRLGLLVWQDFMFAGTMYPYDQAFLSNVEDEVRQQIKRIRSHPSLALWCGNNEVSEGFHNWNWEDSLHWTANDSVEIWNGYEKLFMKLLPDLVKQYDPHTAYWPSSPSVGWGRPESITQGDSHYWGVWWGEEPFTKYEEKVGRFMSEYGFQSLPSYGLVEKFTDTLSRFLTSDQLLNHQKHSRGMQLIQEYMAQEYPVPTNLHNYQYVSQLLQAGGITRAIEAHRRARPDCMGTLFWQLNDCWPSISWSAIDYNNQPKALYYRLNDAFTDVLLSFEMKNDSIKVYVINDLDHSFEARIQLSMFSFSGVSYGNLSKNILISAESSANMLQGPISFFNTLGEPDQTFLLAEIFQGDRLISAKPWFFVSPKALKLKNIHPKITSEVQGSEVVLTVYSDYLIKDVMLESDDTEGFFDRNDLDVLPGQTQSILFTPSGKVPVTDIVFTYQSLNQLLSKKLP